MPDPIEPTAALADYPVIIEWPVQWGDMDAFGHVNNTVYFRWFESSRIAYLERIGLGEKRPDEGLGPILAAIGCNYRRQLTYPDRVRIGARVTRIGRSSVGLDHAIWSTTQGALAADGQSTLVVYNYLTQRSHPVPDWLRKGIETIENKPFPAG